MARFDARKKEKSAVWEKSSNTTSLSAETVEGSFKDAIPFSWAKGYTTEALTHTPSISSPKV
jgi:pterin-4a-carbinolamine dehydratase